MAGVAGETGAPHHLRSQSLFAAAPRTAALPARTLRTGSACVPPAPAFRITRHPRRSFINVIYMLFSSLRSDVKPRYCIADKQGYMYQNIMIRTFSYTSP